MNSLKKNSSFFTILILYCFFNNHALAQSPNIIFILTDDQRWDALGHAGNEVINTPEMDRLAEQGAYFRNAFVTTPICAASRASFITGLYEHTHDYTFGPDALRDEFIPSSYPLLLREAGYHTGFYGKFGIKYDKFDELFDVGESYDRNGRFKDHRGYFYKTLDDDTVHLTRYTGQKALDFIDQAPAGKPFSLSLSFSAPHAHDPAEAQYFWQEEVDGLYADKEMAPAPISEDRYFDEQPEFVKAGLNRERWYWRYDTPEKYQHSVKGYYRMISGIDLEIGRIRKKLEEKGMADNTVIILMGDNGYFLNERQFAGKWLMYDNSLRVPLIIYDPRSNQPQDISTMALNIDVPATMLQLAGVDVPDEYEGLGLLDLVQGKKSKLKRKYFHCEHLWDFDRIPASEGIRTEQWKYFRYRDYPEHEELYDLEKDPMEINNLAKNPNYRKVLKKMRKKLEVIIK